MGGNLVILEEAAYVAEETFLEIVVPVLSLEEVCFIALSTKDEKPSNFFNQLLKSDFFYKYEICYVCEKCIKKGVRTICKHKMDSLPHWSSEGRVETIKKLFGAENEEKFMRENLGVVEQAGPECFSERKIAQVLTNMRISFHRAPRFFFIAVDPMAGSDIAKNSTSEFAVLVGTYPGNILVGMDAYDVIVEEDYQERLVAFLRKLREIPMCQDTTFVLDVESGTGLEAGNIDKLVRKHFYNVITVCDFHRKPGTKTSNPAKKVMMELTRDALNTDNISILKEFVTLDRFPNRLLARWASQMKSFSRIVSTGNSLRSHNTEIFTGKTGKKMDDLSMTFLRLIRLMEIFMHDPKYIHYRR